MEEFIRKWKNLKAIYSRQIIALEEKWNMEKEVKVKITKKSHDHFLFLSYLGHCIDLMCVSIHISQDYQEVV